MYLAVLRIWAQLRSYVIYERCLDGVDHVGTARGGEDKADSVTRDEATGGCMVRSARLRSSVSLFVSAWSVPSIRRLVAVAICSGHATSDCSVVVCGFYRSGETATDAAAGVVARLGGASYCVAGDGKLLLANGMMVYHLPS